MENANRFRTVAFKAVLLMVAMSLFSGCVKTETPAPTEVSPVSTPTATATPAPTTAEGFLERGDQFLWVSDFDAAEKDYEAALKLDDGYALAYSHQAFLQGIKMDSWSEALALAQKAVELEPENAEARAYLALLQGMQHHENDMLATAEKAVSLSDQSALAHVALGQAYLARHEMEKAEAELQQALKLDAENVPALLALADWYQADGDHEQAILTAGKAVAQAPKSVYALVALADAHLQAWEYDEAEQVLSDTFKLVPTYLPAGLEKAEVYLRQSDRVMTLVALKDTRSYVKTVPAISSAWGWVHLDKESYDAARKEFEMAIEADENYWPAYVGLGTIYLAEAGNQMEIESAAEEPERNSEGKLLSEVSCGKAVEQFHIAVNLNPYSGLAHASLALGLECKGDFSRAAEGYKWALDLAPYDPTVLASSGAYWVENAEEQEEYDEGFESLRQAMMETVDDPNLYLQMGVFELNRPGSWGSESNLLKATALDAENVDAWVQLGLYYLSEEKYNRAIDTFDTALALDEENPMANYGKGVAYALKGKSEKALPYLEAARDNGVDEPMVYLYLGRIYRENKELKKAAEAFNTFVESAPEDFDTDYIKMAATDMKSGNFWLTESQALMVTRLIAMDMADSYEDEIRFKVVSVQFKKNENDERALEIIIQTLDEDVEEKPVVQTTVLMLDLGMLVESRIQSDVDGGVHVVVRNSEGKEWVEAMVSREMTVDVMDGLKDRLDMLNEMTLRVLNRPTVSSFRDEVLEEIFQRVAEDRGMAPRHGVTSHTITTETLHTNLQADYDADREAQTASAHLMVLLGLIDSSVDMEKVTVDMGTENIAGYYDPRRDTFFVISNDPANFFNADNEVTAAHEYMHALQDQYRGLDESEMNDDEQLAFRALVEGEAMQVTFKYIEEYLTLLEQTRVFGMDRPQHLAQAEGEDVTDEDTPPILSHFENFPYVTGLDFVESKAAGGYWPALDKIYQNPPASTEQVLHPEKYEGEERDDPQVITLTEKLADLGDEWKELDNDVMGEYFTREYLAAHISPDLASVSAAGWDGDRYAYFEQEKDSKRRLLVWKTVWDSPEEAREFVVAHRVAFEGTEGYTETVRELSGGDRTVRWESKKRVVYLRQVGDMTWLVFASKVEDLDKVLPLLEADWKKSAD